MSELYLCPCFLILPYRESVDPAPPEIHLAIASDPYLLTVKDDQSKVCLATSDRIQ